MHVWFTVCRCSIRWFAGLSVVCLIAVGCGKPPAAEAPQEDPGATAEATPAKKPGKASKRKPGKTAGTNSGKGGEAPHIGEIPKDAWPEVFFDEPLTVLAESDPTGVGPGNAPAGNPAASNSAPPSEAPSEPTTPTETSAKGADWEQLLTGEDLARETKAVRASLSDKLQSVGKYNGNYKELRVDAATLTALANIAAEHSGAPPWKANARFVRDLSAEVSRSSSSVGDKYYKPARAAYDKLEALLTGGKPDDLEESAEKLPISELVSRVPLMYRMERAYNWMKLNINTEPLFKKELSKLAHEGAILAVLARMIADPTYPDGDDDTYRNYANELTQSGLGVVKACANEDFSAFTAALDRGGKACAGCHLDFKNN